MCELFLSYRFLYAKKKQGESLSLAYNIVDNLSSYSPPLFNRLLLSSNCGFTFFRHYNILFYFFNFCFQPVEFSLGVNHMTEQGSNFEEKGKTEMMNVQEVARMTEWLRAKGMSDTEILNCMNYIATGVGLPTNIEPSEVKESE